MNAPHDDQHKLKTDEVKPVRDRSADLIEEARLAGGGLGILSSLSYFQALIYLVILGTLTLIVIWALRPG